MGQDERARGRRKGQTPVWGRAHAAGDPPAPTGTLRLRLRLRFWTFRFPVRFDETRWARTAFKHARNPYDTKRPRFQRAIRKCTPLCASKPSARVTEFLLRLIEPSAIISAHLLTLGNPRESVCRVPGGYSKPAQGYSASARGYSEDARKLHLKAPALMCSRNSRGRESAAQGAVEEGVEEAFRPPEFY